MEWGCHVRDVDVLHGLGLMVMFGSPGSRLMTARDLAGGELFGLEFRKTVLASCGRDSALRRIAALACELDLSLHSGTRGEVERRFISTLGPDVRPEVTRLRSSGMALLWPASLHALLKEVVEFASDEESDLGTDDLVHCLLGVGHDMDDLGVDEREFPRLPPSQQREIQDRLNVHEVAMLSFMRDDPLEVVAAQAQYFWREPWPVTEPHRTKGLGASPAAMFTEVMGVDYDEFLRAGWAIRDFIDKDGPTIDPVELQRRYGLSESVVTLVREQCTIPFEDLRTDLREQRAKFDESALLRFNLQRRPLIILPDETWLATRVQFTVQRFFGDMPSWDVKETLELTDTQRAERFRQGMAFVFEQRVGDVLERIATSMKHCVIVTETAMKNRFKSKKTTPKVCDWAMASGRNWVLLEVNNRRLVQRLAEGIGSFEDLRSEITKYLSETKFNQLFSTIDLFLERGWNSASAKVDEESVFVPLVVVPDSGLQTSFLLEHEIKELVRTRVTRYPGVRVMPPTVVAWRELCVLEGLAEHGVDVADTLRRWRFQVGSGRPESLQDFLWRMVPTRPRSQFDLRTGADLLADLSMDREPPAAA